MFDVNTTYNRKIPCEKSTFGHLKNVYDAFIIYIIYYYCHLNVDVAFLVMNWSLKDINIETTALNVILSSIYVILGTSLWNDVIQIKLTSFLINSDK